MLDKSALNDLAAVVLSDVDANQRAHNGATPGVPARLTESESADASVIPAR